MDGHAGGNELASGDEDGGGSGGAVAVSLIDALQRWADALEAQIDIMKSEVEGVRASNKELARQGRTDGRRTIWFSHLCLLVIMSNGCNV